jgi:hypothetical protein
MNRATDDGFDDAVAKVDELQRHVRVVESLAEKQCCGADDLAGRVDALSDVVAALTDKV